MAYRVEASEPAERDLRDALTYLVERSPDAAARWFEAMEQGLERLRHMPQRCPVAAENEQVERITVRQLIVGRRRGRYRVLFAVEEPDRVLVLRVQHGAQDTVKLEDEDWDPSS